jgi:hypothetical protein
MQKEYTRPETRPLARCMVLGVVICAAACMGNRSRGSGAGQGETTEIADGGVVPAARRDASGARGTTSDRGSAGTGLVGLVPAPPHGQGAARIVPAGTTLTLASNARVCTYTYHPGDTFTATVTDTVTVAGGAIVPAGSLANFEVTALPLVAHGDHARRIGIALDSLAIDGVRYPARAHITSVITRKVRSPPVGQADVTTVGPGAETADILGVILTHSDRSTVIGARQSAGDPAAEASVDFCIPRNGRITLTLTADERLQ